MQAAWYEKQGAARDVIQYGEMPVPEPSSGEVRIRVYASITTLPSTTFLSTPTSATSTHSSLQRTIRTLIL